MHRYIAFVGTVAAATFLVVGCGSSSDNSPSNSGGSGGSSSDAQCVGAYANLTQSAFSAEVSTDGKCAGASDVKAVCGNDVTTAAEECGGSCYRMGGTPDVQDACTATCLNTMVVPALGDDCLACYVADVDCARTHCLVLCGIAPTSQGCADCRETNGCVSAFYSCSGVPVPGGAATDGNGGMGGEPAGSAGAGG